MSSRRDGDQDEAVSEEGITMYNKILTSSRVLKSAHVPAIRKLYNKRAREMGILPTLKESKNKKYQCRMTGFREWIGARRPSDFCSDRSGSNEGGSEGGSSRDSTDGSA
jgi:hypothetical protein